MEIAGAEQFNLISRDVIRQNLSRCCCTSSYYLLFHQIISFLSEREGANFLSFAHQLYYKAGQVCNVKQLSTMNQHSQYIRVLVQPLSRIPTIEPGQGNFDDVIRVFLHLSLVAAVGTITSHLLTFIFSLVSPIVNVIILFVLTNILTTPQTINTDIVLPISVILEVTTSFASPSSPIISCILYSFYAQICIIIALFLLDIKFEVIPSFVFVCLLRSVTPSRSVILRCLIQVSGALIGVTVARIIEQMISLTNPETSDGRLIAWKKRRSSSSSSSSSVKIRRTSLPLLLGSRSHSIGNPVSVLLSFLSSFFYPFPLSLSLAILHDVRFLHIVL